MRDILVEGLLIKPDGEKLTFMRRYKQVSSANSIVERLVELGYYVVVTKL